MQAYQLVEWQQPPEMREVEVPEPGPGEVLIKVGGAGACHSDLHLMEWPAGRAAVRAAVHARPRERRLGRGGRRRRRRAGRWATPSPSTARGAAAAAAPAGPRSRRCASARAEIGAAGGGLGRDGGMAEYMLVPAHAAARAARRPRPARRRAALRRRADALPRDQARAAEARARARSRVVIGVGGLGHMAVQLLRALSPGARSSRVDVDAGKLELAARGRRDGHRRSRRGRRRGDPRAHRRPRRRAGPRLRRQRRHLALDAAGRPGRRRDHGHRRRRRHAAADLRRDCRSTRSITYPYWGSAIELAEVLDLARTGRIPRTSSTSRSTGPPTPTTACAPRAR